MKFLLLMSLIFAVNSRAAGIRVRLEKRDILTLPVEDYLRGVVPQEMSDNWPIEALKAQAVAARSFAYRRILFRQARSFDVQGSVLDQKFQYPAPAKRSDRAIRETRGLILIDSEDQIFEALYHADCGGRTEDAANVWGGESLMSSHPDCPHPSHHWSVELDRSELSKRLLSHFGLASSLSLKSLQAVGHTASGRVKFLRVDFTGGETRTLSSQDFRRLVGFSQVPSTNFRLRWSGSKLLLTGVGRGHGVGLCQLGARAMAKQGKSFREILSFYYPKARLINIADWRKSNPRLAMALSGE